MNSMFLVEDYLYGCYFSKKYWDWITQAFYTLLSPPEPKITTPAFQDCLQMCHLQCKEQKQLFKPKMTLSFLITARKQYWDLLSLCYMTQCTAEVQEVHTKCVNSAGWTTNLLHFKKIFCSFGLKQTVCTLSLGHCKKKNNKAFPLSHPGWDLVSLTAIVTLVNYYID